MAMAMVDMVDMDSAMADISAMARERPRLSLRLKPSPTTAMVDMVDTTADSAMADISAMARGKLKLIPTMAMAMVDMVDMDSAMADISAMARERPRPSLRLKPS